MSRQQCQEACMATHRVSYMLVCVGTCTNKYSHIHFALSLVIILNEIINANVLIPLDIFFRATLQQEYMEL